MLFGENMFDKEDDPLTYEVIGAAMEVHRLMGPGLLESVYQSCLEEELTLRRIEHYPQYRIPLRYKSKQLNQDFVIDICVPKLLVVELKSVDKIIGIHEAQLLSYLRLSEIKTGLLINFNVPLLREGIKRMKI